jgi:hypothetical protein
MKSGKRTLMMDIQQSSNGPGTRTWMVGFAALACMLVIGLAIRFAYPRFLGNTIANRLPAVSQPVSGTPKHDPEGQEDATPSRSAVKPISEPINLTQAQRATLRSIFAPFSPPRVHQPNFELMIGTGVAKQTPLADLPPEVPKVLSGFSGDQYVIAGEDLVIVDRHSHRVAAIIGNVK